MKTKEGSAPNAAKRGVRGGKEEVASDPSRRSLGVNEWRVGSDSWLGEKRQKSPQIGGESVRFDLGFAVKGKELEWKWPEGTPRSKYVNAVDKGLRGKSGVNALDKGVTGEQRGWRPVSTKKHTKGGYVPSRYIHEDSTPPGRKRQNRLEDAVLSDVLREFGQLRVIKSARCCYDLA